MKREHIPYLIGVAVIVIVLLVAVASAMAHGAASFQPSPVPAIADELNALVGHAEPLGYAVGALSVGQESANLPDIIFLEFDGSMVAPTAGSAMADGVARVLLWGRPSQVVGAVVCLIAIVVGNLMLWRWARTIESRTHQLTGRLVDCLAVARNIETAISLGVKSLRQNVSGPDADAGLRARLVEVGIGAPTNAAKVADLVVRPAFYKTPFFCTGIGSHIALLTRAVWLGASRRANGFWPRHYTKIIALFLLVVAAPAAVMAHGDASWIMDEKYKDKAGWGCCGVNDCAVAKPGEMARIPGGWLHIPTQTKVMDNEVGIYLSIDAQLWRCVRGGQLKCVFPGAGL